MKIIRKSKISILILIGLLVILPILIIYPFKDQSKAKAAWYSDVSWPYRQRVIVDHTKVANTDQSNFPVLIKITSQYNQVFSLAKDDGSDILFTDSNGNKLSHQIQYFSKTDKELDAWVKISSLSHLNDTTLYMYYGNSGASNQQNIADVWSNGYSGVWNLSDNAASTVVADSLGSKTGTSSRNTSLMSTTSRNAKGLNFNGSDSVATTLDIQPSAMSSMTFEAWVNPSVVGGRRTIFSDDDGGYDRGLIVEGSNLAIFTGSGAWQPVAASVSTWQHVVVVYTPSTMKL